MGTAANLEQLEETEQNRLKVRVNDAGGRDFRLPDDLEERRSERSKVSAGGSDNWAEKAPG